MRSHWSGRTPRMGSPPYRWWCKKVCGSWINGNDTSVKGHGLLVGERTSRSRALDGSGSGAGDWTVRGGHEVRSAIRYITMDLLIPVSQALLTQRTRPCWGAYENMDKRVVRIDYEVKSMSSTIWLFGPVDLSCLVLSILLLSPELFFHCVEIPIYHFYFIRMRAFSLFPSLSLLLGLSTQPTRAAANREDINITRHSSPLPEVPGAKIDRSSLTVGDGGTLVHYISGDVGYNAATQAIIVIHGRQRDANNSFAAKC
jgi:hypothetical protein